MDKQADSNIADEWLAAELNRIWMVSERALRSFQRAQIRPQPGHPSIAEVEAILTARRTSRLGNQTAVEDEAALTKAIEEAEAKLVPLRKKAMLGRLINNLELRPLEVETLVVSIAPHLDAPLAEIFNVLKGPTSGRRGVDLALVSQLFRLKRHERVQLLDALDPERPLLRWRLLQVLTGESMEAFSSMSHRAFKPTFDLVSTLCGRSDMAPELSRFCSFVHAQPTLDDLRFEATQRQEVEAFCQAAKFDIKPGGPWLVVWGPEGVGKKTVAARIAAYANRAVMLFDPTTILPAHFEETLSRVQREALIRDAALYIGPLTAPLLENGARDLTRRLKGYRGTVIFGGEGMQPPRIITDHPIWELALRIPPEPVRAQIWDDALPASVRAPDVNLESIARAFNLTPGEIVRSARESRTISRIDQGRQVSQFDVRSGVDRRLRNDLGDLAKRITVVTTWNDLVLPRQDMDRIEEFVSRRKHFDLVYRTWGFGDRIGYGKGLIGLFSGPPGTGKTMLAGLIAQALDLDLYQVDISQVVSKWVGETEKQLGQVFDRAERAHAVLLFDEADSLFAKRTEVKGSNDRYGNMSTNYLLQRLEQYTGVAVLTTNKDTALDEALQRRLTLHLRLEIPDIAERERLWQTFLPPKAPIEAGINLKTLANEFELSGGYIKNAAVRAAFLAASVGAPIGMEILRLASALELEDMGRVVFRREQGGSSPLLS